MPNPYDIPGWHGTGALPLTHDPRDWSALLLPEIAQAVHSGVPTVARLGGTIGEVYDQGQYGACVAASEAGVISREETIMGRPWVSLDWYDLYVRNGGHGSNGVDTRQTLEDILRNGIKRKDGGEPIHEAAYLFVPKNELWEPTIMAALAVGKAVTLATYLPTLNGVENFGWDSDGVPNPSRYHQFYLDAGDPDWWELMNTWGPGFGRNGRGRIKKSYVDWRRPDVYAYIITPVGVLPPPPPPPPPPPVTRRTIAAVATGEGVGMLAVGQSLTAGTVNLQITQITEDNPLPPPPPPPPTGDLNVSILPLKDNLGRNYAIQATVTDKHGVQVVASCSLKVGARNYAARRGAVVQWQILFGSSGRVQVSAVTDDGRSGHAEVILA